MKQGRGIEVTTTQQGPNSWVATILGFGLIIVMGILAAAIWSLAYPLGIAVLCVGVGVGLRNAAIGVGFIITATGEARAKIIRAQGEAGRLIEGEQWERLGTGGDG